MAKDFRVRCDVATYSGAIGHVWVHDASRTRRSHQRWATAAEAQEAAEARTRSARKLGNPCVFYVVDHKGRRVWPPINTPEHLKADELRKRFYFLVGGLNAIKEVEASEELVQKAIELLALARSAEDLARKNRKEAA